MAFDRPSWSVEGLFYRRFRIAPRTRGEFISKRRRISRRHCPPVDGDSRSISAANCYPDATLRLRVRPPLCLRRRVDGIPKPSTRGDNPSQPNLARRLYAIPSADWGKDFPKRSAERWSSTGSVTVLAEADRGGSGGEWLSALTKAATLRGRGVRPRGRQTGRVPTANSRWLERNVRRQIAETTLM